MIYLRKLALLFFFSLIYPQSLFSLKITDPFTKNNLSQIQKGLDFLHNGEYKKSIEVFNKLKKDNPDHPGGHMFYAASLEWLMFDFRNFYNEEQFLESINKAIDLSDEWKEREPENPWAYFYSGGAYGFRGIYYTDYGNLFQTFRDGLVGYTNLKRVLELKNDFYDAYFGVSMWFYWRNHYIRFFGAEKKRIEGIELLNLTIEKGFLTVVEAQSSLIRIFFNEERYDEAHGIIDSLLKRYPNYLYARWYKAKGYKLTEEWDKMIDAYLWLNQYFLKNTELLSQTALIEVNYHIALGYYNLKQFEKSQQYVDMVLNNDVHLEKKNKYADTEQEEINEKAKLLKSYKKKSKKLDNKIKKKINQPQ